jgi:aminoglycoside 3-N-acetyltransferase
MPAYPIKRSTIAYLETNPLFDPDESPSHMGKITEELRLWPGAARSIHPTHSISAVGRDAGELMRDHYRAATPFSLDTPFGKLLERDAWVLCMGVGLEPTAFYHVFEDVTEGYPLSVYRPDPECARILLDGTEFTIEIPVHDPELAQFRIDHDDRVRERVTEKLSEYGFLRQGKVGHGDSYLIRAKDLMVGLERMLGEGIVIYNTDRMNSEGWELPAEIRGGLEQQAPRLSGPGGN